MKKKSFIQPKRTLVLQAAALVIYFSLMLVSGVNFIIYAGSSQSQLIKQALSTGNADENIPEKPVEEKTAISISISEELLHENSCLYSHFLTPITAAYFILHTESLSIVHYDLLSPPPDKA